MSSVGSDVELEWIVATFAVALGELDQSAVVCKQFRPGIGPFGEAQAVKFALDRLRRSYPEVYRSAETKRCPDVLIPDRWALEFKIVRPFGDNGREAEHWSQNLLHPYRGNTSVLGDCLKLLELKGNERRGVVVFAFEHSVPKVDLNVLYDAFELIARKLMGIVLGPRHKAVLPPLQHPVHQAGAVVGWEVLGRVPVTVSHA